MIEVEWAGESLILLHQRALLWARRSTLCIADWHLGKCASFRHAGLPVPDAPTGADLDRLSDLVRTYTPRRLVILGDLLHAPTARSPETLAAFSNWRAEHADLEILLIRGNHDARAGDPPADWRIRCANEPHADPGDARLCFSHYPEAGSNDSLGRFALAGHLHPAVHLIGPAASLRSRCFWFGRRVAVLPAFGSFTGSASVRPSPGDRVFAIGEGRLAEVPIPPARRKVGQRA